MSRLKEKLHYDQINNCVQCGYCLPVCPTYQSMGSEVHSPRGRITLAKMVAEEKMKPEEMEQAMAACLGCQACVTACPTDVAYGRILDGARELLAEQKKPSLWLRLVQGILLKKLIPSRMALHFLGSLIWLYQITRLSWLIRPLLRLPFFPEKMVQFEQALPKLEPPWSRKRHPEQNPAITAKQNFSFRVAPATPVPSNRTKVAFFQGCIMDTLFYTTNQNSIQLLQLAGLEVVVPSEQSCCGALHAHLGDRWHAQKLAKRNIAAFEASDVQYIVHNAGGCGAMFTEYGELFADDPEWRERAERIAQKSVDISQLLVNSSLFEHASIGEASSLRGLPSRAEEAGRSGEQLELAQPQFAPSRVVTYQPSCHLTHVQGVRDEPWQLLQRISQFSLARPFQLRKMKDQEGCCGSAGIYNFIQYEESMKILDHKMAQAEATQASIIVTTNPGCLLQMKLGIQRLGRSDEIEAVHLVDFLAGVLQARE